MDKIIFIWLGVINVAGFFLMGIDKYKAKHGRWRISEKALFIAAIIGGSLGSFIGMQVFRHKTKHRKFTIGIPAVIVVHAALLVWFWL